MTERTSDNKDSTDYVGEFLRKRRAAIETEREERRNDLAHNLEKESQDYFLLHINETMVEYTIAPRSLPYHSVNLRHLSDLLSKSYTCEFDDPTGALREVMGNDSKQEGSKERVFEQAKALFLNQQIRSLGSGLIANR